MQLISINTVDDIKTFLHYLISDLDLNFHPDNCFTDYVTPTGEQVFTEAEAVTLEDLLERAFFVCEELNTNLYSLGLEVFLQRHPELKMAA